MTRFEVEELLSKVIEKLPKFGTTIESEFAINWREKKIMFYGKYYWKYELFDKEGNISVFEPVKNPILATPEVPEGGVYQEIDNCDAMVISWIDEEENEPELNVGLRDSEKLNIEKIKDYLLHSKEMILECYYEYWKDYQKMHQWNMKALEHVVKLRKKLDEYQGAAMEPDMNILAYIRKEMNEEMDKFEQEFQNHFFPEKQ